MEAKNFKIGNYYLDINDCLSEMSSYELYQMTIKENKGNLGIMEYQPIPITETKLLELRMNISELKLANGNKIELDIRNNTVWLGGNESCIDDHGFVIENVKYIHQLQNLLFDLIGHYPFKQA